jgi:hypothetical protein
MAARDTLHDPPTQLFGVSLPCPSCVGMARPVYPASLLPPWLLEGDAHGSERVRFSETAPLVAGVIL